MKKLLKISSILAILACGLFIGCNNGDMDLDLNVTVSTDTPQLNSPENFGYGVLLTWRCTQDGDNFKITRQVKDSEEKVLGVSRGKTYFDAIGVYNVLEEGVEYTYRVYNLGDKGNAEGDINISNSGNYNDYGYGRAASGANYGTNYIVKDSYAEKRITLAAGSLKAQGEALPKIAAEDVVYTCKNDRLTIALKDSAKAVGTMSVVARDAETGEKQGESNYGYISNIRAKKINVEIKNVSEDGYYKDSEATTITGIENVSDDSVTISNLQATLRDKAVVLLWTTDAENATAEDFTVSRKENSEKEYKALTVVTVTSGTKYDGTKYWTATDNSIKVGKSYTYKVVTKESSDSRSVNTSTFVWLASPEYDGVANTVTLKWNASKDLSAFTIYRADKKLNYDNREPINIYTAYDLLKPIEITPVLVKEGIDDNNKPVNIYTAEDKTVEKNKDYTYVITPKSDGVMKIFSAKTVSTELYEGSTLILNSSIYDKDGNPRRDGSLIEEPKDYVVLDFKGDINATYKGFWTTIDNKGNESKRTPFDYSNDKDGHYLKRFNTSGIADFTKPVAFTRVKFYVQEFVGGKFVQEANREVDILQSLTSYTTFYLSSVSQDDPTKREISLVAYGQNFDKIKVTYFKDGTDKPTPVTVAWTQVAGTNQWTGKFTVKENGTYTVCATIPANNMYYYQPVQESNKVLVNVN